MYKHVYICLSVQARLPPGANACILHEPYTLHLICTVHICYAQPCELYIHVYVAFSIIEQVKF